MQAANKASDTVAKYLLIAVVGTLYVFVSWHTDYSDLLSDSAIYLLLAAEFSPFQTVPDALFTTIVTEYHLPPGYPLALAVLGGGAQHPTLSHAVNALFLASGVAMYLFWLQSERCTYKLLLALVFALLPATLYFSNIILSENLFIPLSLLSLLLIGRLTESPRLLYAAALTVGFAILTRTIGIALLPALLLTVYKTDKHSTVKALVVAVALPLAWIAYKSQFNSYSYLQSFVDSQGSESLSATIRRISINTHILWSAWVKSFGHSITIHASVLSAGVLLLAIIGWIKRIRMQRADAVYVFVYLCALLVWPHASHMQRFLFPLLPILLFYAYACFSSVSIRFISTPTLWPVSLALPGLILIVALPIHALVLKRVITPAPPEIGAFARGQLWLFSPDESQAKNDSLFLNRLYSAIEETNSIDAKDCIWSIDPPRHMLLSMRASYELPPPGLQQATFDTRMLRCKYVFAMNVRPHPNPLGYEGLYPANRLGLDYEIIQTSQTDEPRIVSRFYKRREALPADQN